MLIFLVSPLLYHPRIRRPRGSQSGRENRRGESVQEPNQTVKRSWLLIGHKNTLYDCTQSAMSIARVLFDSTRLLSRHTCPVRSPWMCVQGKISFSTFLTRNEGTIDESEKRFGCSQQEHFNLHRETSVSDRS